MDNGNGVNAAILERLEKVVQSLQENSVKMGQLLAVHDEKLDKQDRIDAVLFEKIEQVDKKLDKHANDIKKGCERDILLVDKRLRTIEKKMWTIAGALTVISFCSLSYRSEICKIIDSTTTIRYNASKVITCNERRSL